jgi:hypothetical protein
MSNLSISITYCQKVCIQIPSPSCQVTYSFTNYSPSILQISTGTSSIIISGIFGTTGTGTIGIIESGIAVSIIYVTVTGESPIIDIFFFAGLSNSTSGNVYLTGLNAVPGINNPNNIFYVSQFLLSSSTQIIDKYYFVNSTNPLLYVFSSGSSPYIIYVLTLNNYPSSNFFNPFPICGTIQQTITTSPSIISFPIPNLQCPISNYITFIQPSIGYTYSSSGVNPNGIEALIGGYSGLVTLSYFIVQNEYVNVSATSGLFFTTQAQLATITPITSFVLTLSNFPVGYATNNYAWFIQLSDTTLPYLCNGYFTTGSNQLTIYFSTSVTGTISLSLCAFIISPYSPLVAI